jgi:hypothetical protein
MASARAGARFGTKKERMAIYRMARDCWVEVLRCPECGKMGESKLSAADGRSWEFHVDHVPHGFKVIQTRDGSCFFCTSCDTPAEP